MIDPQPNDAFAWTQASWGRMLVCRRIPAAHLFTSRDVVLRGSQQEWEAVAASLGVAADRLRLIRQVHGTDVVVCRQGEVPPSQIPEGDVIVSNDASVAIGVRVADCAPLLLFDSRTGAVAAAHAGWRGTAAGVAAVVVRAMHDAFGTDPADVIAAIGPCLGACCGEVGPEVVEAFRAGGASERSVASWFRAGNGDRSWLDLPGANRDQLQQAGVPCDRIFVADLCTRTHLGRLHSYRGSGAAAGRMLAGIRVSQGSHAKQPRDLTPRSQAATGSHAKELSSHGISRQGARQPRDLTQRVGTEH
ncbi:MAG TPA: polyphenol oxidase family protein [Vicinamibacterales bacterium]|nr:polyphenol oxidase family protein [Vicinamibacterales bacterium]